MRPASDDDLPLFAWAHLSDLHVGRGDAGDAHGRRMVLDALKKDLVTQTRGDEIPKLDAILVTGDAAWSGAKDEYDEAAAWLVETAEAVGVTRERIHVVPGNHDVDRAAGADRNTARLLAGLRGGSDPLDTALADAGDRASLQRRLAPYLAFAGGFAPGCGDLFWVHCFEARGLKVRLVGLNTALLAAGEVDKGKLQLGKEQLAAALRDPAEGELIVVLSHHPFRGGWLADEKNADAWIRNHAHLHLFGHVKDHDSEEALSGAGGDFVRIAAGAAYREGGEHGYSIAAIVRTGDGSLAVRIWPRRWSDRNKQFRLDVGSAPEEQRHAEHRLRLRHPREEVPRHDREERREKEVLNPAPLARNFALYEGPGGVPISGVPHFLGRDDELRDLRDALLTDAAVCVVASGLGGIGKRSRSTGRRWRQVWTRS